MGIDIISTNYDIVIKLNISCIPLYGGSINKKYTFIFLGYSLIIIK